MSKVCFCKLKIEAGSLAKSIAFEKKCGML